MGFRAADSPAAGWIARHRLELKLGLRMTAAGLAAYTVAQLLGLVQGYWAVLTAVIVMQASLGGSLKAMLDRLAGTIGGAGCGILATMLVPRSGPVSVGLTLALALVPLAALVAFKPNYRVAPITAVIIVLVSPGSESALAAGLARTAEIALGSVIALAVAFFLWPSRAQDLLLEAVRDGLAAVADLIGLLLEDLRQVPDPQSVRAGHDRLRGIVERAAGIAGEAARERASHISEAPDADPLVRALRRVGHDLVMVARVRAAALPEPVAARLAPAAAAVPAAARDFAAASNPAAADAVRDAVEHYAAALAALRGDGVTRELSVETVEQVYGLAFALDQLGRNLAELGSRIAEFAGLKAPPPAPMLAGEGGEDADRR